MFFPTSLKLWRTKEELEGLVDLCASKMLNGEMMQSSSSGASLPAQNVTNGATAFRKAEGGGSGSSSTPGDRAASRTGLSLSAKEPVEDESAPPPLLSLGTSARRELLLERLPYMSSIAKAKKCSLSSVGIRDLEKLV